MKPTSWLEVVAGSTRPIFSAGLTPGSGPWRASPRAGT